MPSLAKSQPLQNFQHILTDIGKQENTILENKNNSPMKNNLSVREEDHPDKDHTMIHYRDKQSTRVAS